jgi:hypothetical protein
MISVLVDLPKATCCDASSRNRKVTSLKPSGPSEFKLITVS